MSEVVWLIIKTFNYLVLGFFIMFNSFYFLTSILAFMALRRS